MKIIPLSDLRNTAAVSQAVIENGVVFVTKQGGQHIVMLAHEKYEEMQQENADLKLHVKVLQSEIRQMKNGGETRPLDEVLKDLKNEYDF